MEHGTGKWGGTYRLCPGMLEIKGDDILRPAGRACGAWDRSRKGLVLEYQAEGWVCGGRGGGRLEFYLSVPSMQGWYWAFSLHVRLSGQICLRVLLSALSRTLSSVPK